MLIFAQAYWPHTSWGTPLGETLPETILIQFVACITSTLLYPHTPSLLRVFLFVKYIPTRDFVFCFLEQSTSFGLGKTEGVSFLACESSEG